MTGNTSSIHLPFGLNCIITRPGSIVYTVYFLINILLMLPICTMILYLGLQQWWQQSSTSTGLTMSHADTFTYHMVIMELFGVFGNILACCGIYAEPVNVLVGLYFWTFPWYGEMFFHILTCLERYLAVVHPITYLSLKRERGIRIRNIIIGCVWLLCIVGTGLLNINFSFLLLIFSLIVVSFCSISVLCTLIRPGPGERGGDRARVDQSKQRAFYTIMAILGMVLLRLLSSLGCFTYSFLVRLCVKNVASHQD